MRKVMVFGTFDTVHPGHLNFFKQARQYGDYLIVVLARDITVKEVKGRLPKKSQEERLQDVASADGVDSAIMGNPNNKHDIIRENSPDVICLGYDQEAFTQDLEKNFPHIQIQRLEPFKEEKYKSSKL